MTKKKNISHFLSAALKYGVPDRYLFRPEDLAVQAHFYKYDVTPPWPLTTDHLSCPQGH